MKLNKKDKGFLLSLARNEILELLGEKAPTHGVQEPPDHLQIRCGAFVSLYCEEKLRGCIGTFEEERSLVDNVKRMARSAASKDTRFESIRPEETAQLKIEISVLTPRKEIQDIQEIIPGLHGIYIQQGSNRGTLLPQVAEREGWDREQFLGFCSKYKAGLGWDGWKDARVYTYEAIVFSSIP